MGELPPSDPRTPPDTMASAGSTRDPATGDLDEEAAVLRPNVSLRRRAAQAGVVLAVVVLVVGLLLHGIGPSPQGSGFLLPSPSPLPLTVLIESNVSFGTLTVNGHTLNDSPPLVTRLFHQGTNGVTLAAPPFGRKTCQFLFPSDQPSADAGCAGGGEVYGPIDVKGVRVAPDEILDLELASADLPPDLAARASATALQAVAAVPLQTVVPAGQYYATGQDTQGHILAQRASAPLHAAVRFGSGAICGPRPFCTSQLDPGLAFAPGQRVWSVGLALMADWRFLPPAGPGILAPGVPLPLPLPLYLAYDGAGSWRVVSPQSPAAVPNRGGTQALADPLTADLCQAGSSLLAAQVQAQSLGGLGGYSLSTPYDRGVEGCVIQLLAGSISPTVEGTFLWRFGVLLAVDTGARTLAPWLPIAPQAEVAAVEG